MNSIKRHNSGVKNSRLRQDLPISINDNMQSFAKIKSSRKFQNLQYILLSFLVVMWCGLDISIPCPAHKILAIIE